MKYSWWLGGGAALACFGMGIMHREPRPNGWWFVGIGCAIAVAAFVASLIVEMRAARAKRETESAPSLDIEALGASVYAHTREPLKITIQINVPQKRREAFMRLVASRGEKGERQFIKAIQPDVCGAVDNYLRGEYES